MKCNVGNTEKIIRVVIGLITAYLGFAVNPWFYVIAAIALLTAAVGFCPVTNLLGINTCKTKEQTGADENNHEQDKK